MTSGHRTAAVFAALMLVAGVALAQEPQKPAEKPEQKPAETQTPPAQESQPAQEAQAAQQGTVQAPVREQLVSGTVDFGYRWAAGKGGSEDVYRSVVNLGEGPKLFGADATLHKPGGKLYDRIDIRASSWGGDPYNTARLEARRAGMYDFRLDYRNIAYFNTIPSFANPFLDQGVLFSQRSFDTTRRLLDTELNLFPKARFSPYLAYYHNSGSGRGVTTFESQSNEYPVATLLDDGTNSYRGGVRVNLSRWNLLLEQGGTTFKDDQQVGFAGGVNPGNRRTPFLGQTLVLRELFQAWGARGRGIFNRAVFEGRPWDKLSFTGQFLYSQPSIDVNYNQRNEGNFVLLETLQFFTGQIARSLSDAKRPRPSGSWTTEFRPVKRVRIVQSWFTDRFHVAGSSFLTQSLNTTTAGIVQDQVAASDRLVLNFNQHQIDAMVDVLPFLTLRGGHRYQWGDASDRGPTVGAVTGPERAELRRHVALAGAQVRLPLNIDVNADLEASTGDRTFFRTDLADYQRGKVRARYRLTRNFTLTGSFAILNNQNPARDVRFDYQSRETAAALVFTPGGGGKFNLILDYTRGTVRSSIPYLVPQDRTVDISRYRDDGHFAGASVEFAAWRNVRVGAGGTFAVSTGSRPTRYYAPFARLAAPVWNRVSWTAEWRWFGFDERLFRFENFHANLFSTGLRIRM